LTAGFSFADGHAGLQKWNTPLFQSPPNTGLSGSSAPNNADYIWLMRNATVQISGAAMP
jgi:hypothetical protein